MDALAALVQLVDRLVQRPADPRDVHALREACASMRETLAVLELSARR